MKNEEIILRLRYATNIEIIELWQLELLLNEIMGEL